MTSALPTLTLGPLAAQTMAIGQTSLTVALRPALRANQRSLFKPSRKRRTRPPINWSSNTASTRKTARTTPIYGGRMRNGSSARTTSGTCCCQTAMSIAGRQSVTATLTPANLIATLTPQYYTSPSLLWNANAPVTPALTFSFQGNQLTIKAPRRFDGGVLHRCDRRQWLDDSESDVRADVELNEKDSFERRSRRHA